MTSFIFFFTENRLHLSLSGDSGMVGARNPESSFPLHPVIANDDILEGVFKGMPQVKSAGYVWRGEDDGKIISLTRGDAVSEALIRIEIAGLLPLLIDSRFDLFLVIPRW